MFHVIYSLLQTDCLCLSIYISTFLPKDFKQLPFSAASSFSNAMDKYCSQFTD